MWIALCCKTRKATAYAQRDRRPPDVPTVVESASTGDRQGHYFMDFWAAYAAVISLEVALRGEKSDRRDRFYGALE